MSVFRRKFVESLPLGKKLWLALRVVKKIFTLPNDVGFFGWDMFTPHSPPWAGDDLMSENFNKANEELLDLVDSKKFKLSLLTYDSVGSKSSSDKNFTDDLTYTINNLRWRHYNVFWSAKYAINSTNSENKNFIECGVGDGISTYFAVKSSFFEGVNNNSKFFLYDSWDGMKAEHLSDSEIDLGIIDEYSYLNIEDTKRNLEEFKDMIVFNQGFLPESLQTADNPTDSAWIHIDLNSSKPTLAALESFHDELLPGGVILFDDYAWNCHQDTRKVADEFFASKDGINFSLPTGQAIYFKHR